MAQGKKHPLGRTEKPCTRCGIMKPLEAFSVHKTASDGRYSACKDCGKETAREKRAADPAYDSKRTMIRLQRRRRVNMEALWRYLLTHPCVDCGEADPIVLEFDHVYGDKDANISNLIRSASWDRIANEIDKCVVRCSNCHARKTARERGWYAYFGRDHDADAKTALTALHHTKKGTP